MTKRLHAPTSWPEWLGHEITAQHPAADGCCYRMRVPGDCHDPYYRPVLEGSMSVTSGTDVEPGLFRAALGRFASGITIVTTQDEGGRWWGFTATSFCSVSLVPPLVLVLIADTAESYPVFRRADGFVVSMLTARHEATARRFATRGADKFAGDAFHATPGRPPVLSNALAALTCETHARQSLGDHLLLVGRVVRAKTGDGEPLIHYAQHFRRLADRPA